MVEHLERDMIILFFSRYLDFKGSKSWNRQIVICCSGTISCILFSISGPLKIKISEKNYMVITLSGFLTILAYKILKKLNFGLKIGISKMLSKNSVSSTLTATLQIWWYLMEMRPQQIEGTWNCVANLNGTWKTQRKTRSLENLQDKGGQTQKETGDILSQWCLSPWLKGGHWGSASIPWKWKHPSTAGSSMWRQLGRVWLAPWGRSTPGQWTVGGQPASPAGQTLEDAQYREWFTR